MSHRWRASKGKPPLLSNCSSHQSGTRLLFRQTGWHLGEDRKTCGQTGFSRWTVATPLGWTRELHKGKEDSGHLRNGQNSAFWASLMPHFTGSCHQVAWVAMGTGSPLASESSPTHRLVTGIKLPPLTPRPPITAGTKKTVEGLHLLTRRTARREATPGRSAPAVPKR